MLTLWHGSPGPPHPSLMCAPHTGPGTGRAAVCVATLRSGGNAGLEGEGARSGLHSHALGKQRSVRVSCLIRSTGQVLFKILFKFSVIVDIQYCFSFRC